MFLKKTIERNPELIRAVVQMHQQGKILPDTFVVDVDTFLENSRKILDAAGQEGIRLYYMLKQLGRNPYLGKKLEEMGYDGAVVVDWKEAAVAMENRLHIAHAGHLVQIPDAFLPQVISYGCDYMTVYSRDKLAKIDAAAAQCRKVQKVMARVIGKGDVIYSGQTAGFYLEELEGLAEYARRLPHVRICGVDSFPCYLYDEEKKDIVPQKNLETVYAAKKILERAGCRIENVNAPSTTSVRTLEWMKGSPVTSAEPGHGLSGTTPLHAVRDLPEIPCVVYLSEVSHNLDQHAYAYGGGYYRRGHVSNCLVGKDSGQLARGKVTPPALDSIDYHFELDREYPEGSSVIMAFRFQIFVTRSDVCLLEGIRSGKPRIIGIYDSQGGKKK